MNPDSIISQSIKTYATIDIGSNSILLYIASKDAEGNFNRILDKSEITRLGKNLVKTGILNEKSIEKSIAVLKEYKKICDENSVSEIAAAGTMALRNASNSTGFIEKVYKETGIEIQIISGEQEAKLSYIAVSAGIGIKEKTLIFDTGGGSTEFIFCSAEGISCVLSINIGAVRLTENFLKSNPVKPGEIINAVNYIDEQISGSHSESDIKLLAGSGGTVTNLAAMKNKLREYNPDLIQGSIITLDELQNLIKEISLKTIEERKKIIGLEPGRADVILAGALIIRSIMKYTCQDKFIVSDYGIRHGLMLDKFG
jgi:exopolyphosphatase/guanosine-5'-triphosphate,3'-diphosphate pyrophosphatase